MKKRIDYDFGYILIKREHGFYGWEARARNNLPLAMSGYVHARPSACMHSIDLLFPRRKFKWLTWFIPDLLIALGVGITIGIWIG